MVFVHRVCGLTLDHCLASVMWVTMSLFLFCAPGQWICVRGYSHTGSGVLWDLPRWEPM